nr:methyl-accepting chemotaxis protein [Brevundimonas aurantiaca]
MFKSLSISIKLMIALGAMMSACGVATLVVLFSLVTLQRSDTAERSAYQISEAATLTLAAAVEQQNALRAYVATGQETARRDYLARKAAFDQAAQALDASDADHVYAAQHQALKAASDAFHQQSQGLMAQAADPATRLQAEARLLQTADLKDIRAAVTAVDQAADAVLSQRSAAKKAAFGRGYAALVVGGILALLVAAAMTVWLVRALSQPIVAMTRAMAQLAGGDLKVSIPAQERGDEIGRMAAAVGTFRDNAVEKARLEAEAQSQRAVSEAEHRANEAEKARIAEEDRIALTALAEGLSAMSNGDLTYRIETEFAPKAAQLKSDFNAAIAQLQQAMGVVLGNVAGIRSGAAEISQAADDLSRRTEQQAASLEETAAALDEITATVNKTAAGARQAADVVDAAKGDAETSGVIVRDAVEAMQAIESSSSQISQIIGVIDEIAFQTNLLALNAGVEAARAGEAGRGFAVVASEVRALAQRSAEAAKEIKTLISTSTSQVGTGVTLVGQTGEALQRIVDRVAEIDGLVSEIAASAQEQAIGLAQVNTAVNQMDQVTQQNAAMVEQSTAASHALDQEAQSLQASAARFKVGTVGQASPAKSAAQRPAASAPASARASTPHMAAALKTLGRGGAALAPKAAPEADGWEEF